MSSLATLALRSARQPFRGTVQAVARRQAHTGPNWHMPFNFTSTSNKAFAAKSTAFLGTAFSIPFIAIYYRWHRRGGILATA